MGAIRGQLGSEARVVSVRSVKAPGFSGLLGGTRLEVIAQTRPPPDPPTTVEPTAAAVGSEQGDGADPAVRGSTGATAAPVGPANRSTEEASAFEATRQGSQVAGQRSPQPRLGSLLRRAGLSEPLIARLREATEDEGGDERPLHYGLSDVAQRIREMAAAPEATPLPSRSAFLGMPGVGRTTALCKWLSAEVFIRGRRGTVASVEFDRPNPAEDLAVFVELLGLEFSRLPPPPGNANAFCYFDVPPLSLTRPDENVRLGSFLDEHRVTGRVLVLSSLYDAALLRQACTIGLNLGCTHLIFTHLDELPQWGKLWDFLIEAPLVPLMLSTGQSLSGEWETDVVGAALRRTFPWN